MRRAFMGAVLARPESRIQGEQTKSKGISGVVRFGRGHRTSRRQVWGRDNIADFITYFFFKVTPFKANPDDLFKK